MKLSKKVIILTGAKRKSVRLLHALSTQAHTHYDQMEVDHGCVF